MKRSLLFGLLTLLPLGLMAGPFSPFQTVPYAPKPRPELYVFGYGGVNWMSDFEGIALDQNPHLDFDMDNGWGAGGGLGLRTDWLGGTRFEAEGFHRSNNIDKVRLNGVSFDSDAEAEITGVMVNFVKELVLGRLYPYVGLGVGYGETDVDLQAPIGAIQDSSASFLWQVIAGLDFPYTQRVSLFLEYRYMPVTNFELLFNPAIGPVESIEFEDLSNHSIFGGIRLAF